MGLCRQMCKIRIILFSYEKDNINDGGRYGRILFGFISSGI